MFVVEKRTAIFRRMLLCANLIAVPVHLISISLLTLLNHSINYYQYVIFFSCQIYSDTKYRCPKDNPTHAERKALKELKSLNHIVIKPADKGSVVVLLNWEDYLTEGLRQLRDPKFYRKIPDDLSNDHMEAIAYKP